MELVALIIKIPRFHQTLASADLTFANTQGTKPAEILNTQISWEENHLLFFPHIMWHYNISAYPWIHLVFQLHNLNKLPFLLRSSPQAVWAELFLLHLPEQSTGLSILGQGFVYFTLFLFYTGLGGIVTLILLLFAVTLMLLPKVIKTDSEVTTLIGTSMYFWDSALHIHFESTFVIKLFQKLPMPHPAAESPTAQTALPTLTYRLFPVGIPPSEQPPLAVGDPGLFSLLPFSSLLQFQNASAASRDDH